MRENGLTLTEMILIIVILGIVTGIGFPTYRNQIRRANFRAAEDGITSVLRLAQTRASAERVTYRVNFNSTNKTYELGSDADGDGIFNYERVELLPKGVSFVTGSTYFEFFSDRTIKMDISDVIITNGYGNIRFYIQGGSGYRVEVGK